MARVLALAALFSLPPSPLQSYSRGPPAACLVAGLHFFQRSAGVSYRGSDSLFRLSAGSKCGGSTRPSTPGGIICGPMNMSRICVAAAAAINTAEREAGSRPLQQRLSGGDGGGWAGAHVETGNGGDPRAIPTKVCRAVVAHEVMPETDLTGCRHGQED